MIRAGRAKTRCLGHVNVENESLFERVYKNT